MKCTFNTELGVSSVFQDDHHQNTASQGNSCDPHNYIHLGDKEKKKRLVWISSQRISGSQPGTRVPIRPYDRNMNPPPLKNTITKHFIRNTRPPGYACSQFCVGSNASKSADKGQKLLPFTPSIKLGTKLDLINCDHGDGQTALSISETVDLLWFLEQQSLVRTMSSSSPVSQEQKSEAAVVTSWDMENVCLIRNTSISAETHRW